MQKTDFGIKSADHKRYHTLATNIIELKTLNQLPFDINVDVFQSLEGGLEKFLEDNKATWHKKCRNKVDNQKVSRARKRSAAECSVASPVKTRLSLPSDAKHIKLKTAADVHSAKQYCFLCGEYESKDFSSGFFRVATFEVDRKVRECAHIIGDEVLLRKIYNGDLIALDAHYHRLCLVKLYKKAKLLKNEDSDEAVQESVLRAQALSELID